MSAITISGGLLSRGIWCFVANPEDRIHTPLVPLNIPFVNVGNHPTYGANKPLPPGKRMIPP